MKVCIPSQDDKGLDAQVGEHFGRVPLYTIVDLDTKEVKVIPNTSHHMGGQGYPPEIMAHEGVDALLCRGLGRRAIGMFEELGIQVYIGARGTVQQTIEAFKEDQLQKATMDSACKEHTFHGEEHHHRGYQ